MNRLSVWPTPLPLFVRVAALIGGTQEILIGPFLPPRPLVARGRHRDDRARGRGAIEFKQIHHR